LDRDPGLDTLLDLDGQVIVLNSEGYRIQFRVTVVPASPEKQHGLDYSLTLHAPSGERLVGFDNSHQAGRRKPGGAQDHKHRLKTVRRYTYRDASSLLSDFYAEAEAVLRERGVQT
jgi:Family of unknown function (DUF6516)